MHPEQTAAPLLDKHICVKQAQFFLLKSCFTGKVTLSGVDFCLFFLSAKGPFSADTIMRMAIVGAEYEKAPEGRWRL